MKWRSLSFSVLTVVLGLNGRLPLCVLRDLAACHVHRASDNRLHAESPAPSLGSPSPSCGPGCRSCPGSSASSWSEPGRFTPAAG